MLLDDYVLGNAPGLKLLRLCDTIRWILWEKKIKWILWEKKVYDVVLLKYHTITRIYQIAKVCAILGVS